MTTPNKLLLNDNHYYNRLDIDSFAQMLKDPSYCYKFYWLEAIVNLINQNVTETTIGDVIDEMIANAWYSVVEYHIHLSGLVKGAVTDGLERAINGLKDATGLANNASKSDIKEAIKSHNSKIRNEKTQITYTVPYRALAGFFANHNVKVNWERRTELTERIIIFDKTTVKLPYVFGAGSTLEQQIFFDSDWIQMINDNTVEILGWIQYEKLKWLQNNNPEVPGLVYKLKQGDNDRKLERVRDLWNGIIDCTEIKDIYTQNPLSRNDFEVDHFVPRSFIMNDELWNLIPMDPSLNSSKNNNLPDWENFFDAFARNQFRMYNLIYELDGIHALFEKCYKDNLHSIWAQQDLYKAGNDEDSFYKVLEKNLQPLYDSAVRQGYSPWQIPNNKSLEA